MGNREKTGLQVWRIIYPLLIFLGVDIVLESVITTGYMSYRIFNGGVDPRDMAVLIQDATAFLMKYSIYLTLARSAVLIPLFFVFMKQDKKNDIMYNRPTKYTSFNPIYFLVIFVMGATGAIGFNYLVTIGVSIIQSIINAIIQNVTGKENVINLFSAFENVAESIYSGGVFLQIVATAVAAPLIEELLFRGLIYKRLRVLVKPIPAMIISAAIFGIAHGNFVQFVYAFLLGIIFAYVYEKFHNIWIPITFHAGANLISVVITNVMPMDYEIPTYLMLLITFGTLAITAALVCLVYAKVKVVPVQNNSEV